MALPKKTLDMIWALKFLWNSRRWIVKDLGGYFGFLRTAFTESKLRGYRGAGGWLISRCAYLRRNDPLLYKHWVEHEASVPFTPSHSITVILAANNAIDFADWIDELAKSQYVEEVIVLGSEQALNAGELVSMLTRNAKTDYVLALASPASINWELMGYVHELLESADAVIWDHDFLENGVRHSPVFKGSFSREMLLDPNTLPAWATRTRYLSSIAWPEGCESLYELGLNVLGGASNVARFPEVLTHHLAPARPWRSTIKVSQDFFGCDTDLTQAQSIEPDLYIAPNATCRVSIIIPTRDRLDLLKNCIDSIQKHQYEIEYEIIVVDNGSADPEFIAWLDRAEQAGVVVGIKCDIPFNWSELNNNAVEVASGNVLIFLNNDIEILDPGWLFKLSAVVLEDGVGAVGPLLLYPDGLIQHAGIVLGFGGYADHIYLGNDVPGAGERGFFAHPLCRRQVSAVTGACLAIAKSEFVQIGGFNEALTVAGDLELCLRLEASGLRNVYLPSARMIHLESASRSRGLPEGDKLILKDVLPKIDHHYNPNLSMKSLTPIPLASA